MLGLAVEQRGALALELELILEQELMLEQGQGQELGQGLGQVWVRVLE